MSNLAYSRIRQRLLVGVGVAAVMAGSALSARAQEPAGSVEQVIVTGSHIATSGVTSPTPLTVVSADDLQARAVTNVNDLLNELPDFRADASPASSASGLSGAGANSADLRSLGTNRTLTLVDGRRFVPSGTTGVVDINDIPTVMIDRVEVVTGGASAGYGSDAVAGVVNLVMKKNYEGVQGEFGYGQSEYHDDIDFHANLLAGTSLLGGRLHLEGALEYQSNDGAGDMYTRPWGRLNYGIITNPAPGTNGLPLYSILPGVINSTMTPTGLFTSGPLKGTTFTTNGTPTTYNYGSEVGSQLMVGGGDGSHNSFFAGFPLLPTLDRKLFYGSASYDITPDISVYAMLDYAKVDATAFSAEPFDYGDLTISVNNAYLPASLKQVMVANGVTSASFGRFNTDFGLEQNANKSEVRDFVFGIKGAIGGGWTFDVSNENGRYYRKYDFYNSEQPALFKKAINAVVNPANGQVVCASTLTNAGNGCVPFDPFGSGLNSQATLNYFLGDQYQRLVVNQDALSANAQGSVFDLPAGPLKAAVGFEYRSLNLRSTSDPASYASLWEYGNAQPISGAYDVKEVYGETEIPVLKDMPFAESLDITGAVRYTDYSISGGATTWKVGAEWQPADLVRFRFTRSEDIRAPNVSELFATASGNSPTLNINDPFTNQQYLTTPQTAGNPNLKPEQGDTLTAGAVLTPSGWMQNLTVTVDYFNVQIAQAISAAAGQDIVNGCYTGDTTLCNLISRGSNGLITTINTSVQNIASIKEDGIDFEAAYTLPLEQISTDLPGTLNFRFLATGTFGFTENTGVANYNLLGQVESISRTLPMVPYLVATSNVGYNIGAFTGLLTLHFISAGHYDNRYVVGPAVAGSSVITINNNNVPSRTYIDLGGTYDFDDVYGAKLQLYGTVNNVANMSPPIAPDSARGVTNYSYYDVIGRYYKVGLRFKL